MPASTSRQLPHIAMSRTWLHRSAMVLLMLLGLVACASTPPAAPATTRPRPAIGLDNLMGRWHVIAHVPYFAERGHVASSWTYTRRDDGNIDVRYAYRTGFGQPEKELDAVGSVIAETGNREWTMRLLKVLPQRYRILELDPKGQWMLVDAAGRELAWILARNPRMSDADYLELTRMLRDDYGYNRHRFWRVAQFPEQLKQLGFEPPKVPTVE